MFERRSLASLLMLVGFSACFVMQVWDQVLKFLGEETVTVAKYQEDELRFPVITACPMDGIMTIVTDSHASFSDKTPVFMPANLDRQQADDEWGNVTLPPSEVFNYVMIYLEGERYFVREFGGRSNVVNVSTRGTLRVDVLDSFEFGRCLVIKSDLEVRSTSGTWLDISANRGPLAVFLSEDGPNWLGVSTNYWTREFEMVKVEPGMSVIAAMIKRVKLISPVDKSSCSAQGDTVSNMACFEQRVTEHFASSSPRHCYLPQIGNATYNLPPCASYNESLATYNSFIEKIVDIEESGQCPKPCVCDQYEIMTRETMMKPHSVGYKDKALFGMYFSTNIVGHIRQQKLYDLGTIVGAVGGSLGLFLGFSCLSFGQMCFDWFFKSGFEFF